MVKNDILTEKIRELIDTLKFWYLPRANTLNTTCVFFFLLLNEGWNCDMRIQSCFETCTAFFVWCSARLTNSLSIVVICITQWNQEKPQPIFSINNETWWPEVFVVFENIPRQTVTSVLCVCQGRDLRQTSSTEYYRICCSTITMEYVHIHLRWPWVTLGVAHLSGRSELPMEGKTIISLNRNYMHFLVQ